jgi:NTE family protein
MSSLQDFYLKSSSFYPYPILTGLLCGIDATAKLPICGKKLLLHIIRRLLRKRFNKIDITLSYQTMKFVATIILFFCYHICSAQIHNIVFEGAGIRGIAYGGVIKVLEEKDLIKDLQKVGGTSAGAITAMALSLGYTATEIDSLIFNTNFKKFNDGRNIFVGGMHRLYKKFGWYRGKTFSKWIGKIIERKTGNAEITFRELFQKGYKELYITGTCLNQQRLIVFSHRTYPDMKVRDALRISMSIPLYFEAVWIDPAGKVYTKGAPGYLLMVDGGIVANFPIQIFDTVIKQVRIADKHTIGIRIDSDEQIAADSKDRNLVNYPIHNFSDYAGAFYTLLLEIPNRNTLTDEDWKRTVSVSSKNIGPRLKKLSVSEKNALVQSGEDAMNRFLGQFRTNK